MGKWLKRLHQLNEEKNQIYKEREATKATKASCKVLLYPFVASDLKGIQKITPDAPKKPTDQEKAESLIDCLRLRDDRNFVRQCLSGIYGSERLALVNEYLEQWQQGSNDQPDPVKSDNAGRYRANVWLREYFEHNLSK